MNNKGFTLIEFIGCIVIMTLIFGIGFGMIKGTRSSTLETLDKVSEQGIINAARTYVIENIVSWDNIDDELYACVKIDDIINNGYFKNGDVDNYKDKFVKVIKNKDTKVITDLIIVEECK